MCRVFLLTVRYLICWKYESKYDLKLSLVLFCFLTDMEAVFVFLPRFLIKPVISETRTAPEQEC